MSVNGLSQPVFFATTGEASANNLVTVVDTGAAGDSFSTIATAPANTAFRGVAFAPGGATPSPTPASTPTLSIGNVTQAEGNASTTNFTFNVTLNSPALTGGVSFTVNTADGTTNPANSGSDYAAIVGASGNIPAGGTSTTVSVTVNGDTTSEANETFFVNLSGITGTTNSSAQGTGTITNDDVTTTPIYVIQGSGMSSPLAGSLVSTSGIVTGKRSLGASNNGFYLQDATGDGNTNTSDGILVFTGSTVPTVNVGDAVQVSGTVTEFESSPTDEPDGVSPPDPKTATEITGPTIVVQATAVPLPAAIDVTSNNVLDPSATSRGAELEKYEFMRLSVSSLTVWSPTNNFGEFWGAESSRPRPFREPGIEAGDPIPAADEPPYAPAPPPFPPIWDGNFERIMVDSGAALTTGSTRRPQVQVTTGTIVTNIVGPLDYAFDAYRIVLDATATPGVSGGVTAATPVPVRAAGEFTVGHANLENFTSASADRMNKASLAIRNILRTPDILGLIEVDTLATATALANKVNADAANPGVNYVAYMSETSSPQDIGYLVNTARVQLIGTPQQYNVAKQFTYCNATSTLHDRPSFILTANMPRSGGGLVPVTVILNHTKSLIATDSPIPYGSCGTGTEGARNREKRRQQAEDIADLIQLHIGENLVVLGDLNAFDFNDGLGDVVGTFRGNPAPADQVVEPSVDRWSYTLTNLLYGLPADQQYSLLFEGNAQALDHVLVNSQMLARKTNFLYAHYNSDFSELFAANVTRPEGLADHDATVAYFLFAGDSDGDGVEDPNDNCPNVANPSQANYDGDAEGDVCDADDDNDGDPDVTDCAPFNSAISHNAVEVCDGIDNDCDGVIDEGFVNTDGDGQADCVDADDDNDGDPDTTDCAPLNSAISHNAVEVCDGIDNDCDGVIDEGFVNTDGDSQADCVDADDDNDGDPDTTDCAPLNSAISHNAVEVCDGIDNDCDGVIDEGFVNTDGDSQADCVDADDDNDGDPDTTDCAPLNSAISHNAVEVCDGIDNDCDGVIDEGFVNTDGDSQADCVDADDDNDGDPDTTDCAPLNSAISHNAVEVCDGIDNDCDGVIDEGFVNTDGDSQADCVDADDDNDGDPDTTDCAPLNSAISHNAVEVCDGIDNDCDGVIDEGFANTDGDSQADCVDADDDNDGDPDTTDCAPLNSAISHNAVEVCDGIDNDCDGVIDEGFANTDGDGQADCVDLDDDNDGVLDGVDNCPFTANSDQADTDGDGFGNTCDFDDDGDGVLDSIDNCPLVANPNQADSDGDGKGDVCDAAIGPPVNKDQCKNGGWQLFNVPKTFKNQGDCIQYVNTGK
jgi:predicted extracellular nuclease